MKQLFYLILIHYIYVYKKIIFYMRLLPKQLLYVIMFLLLSITKGFCVNNSKTLQDIILQGKVIDAVTKKIIPYSSIRILNTSTGTSSNDDGEFELKTKKLPIELIISHIGYQEQKIKVTKKNTELLIKLMPLNITLDEVLVKNNASTSNLYAVSLAQKAYYKVIQSSKKTKYGKAYYRQKSKINNQYTELSEIIYDVKFDTDGIINWDIIEGRYALKQEGINNRNYTFFSRVFRSLQPDTKDLIFPLSEDMNFLYTIDLVEKIESNSGTIQVLSFKPTKKYKTPITVAEVYINQKTNEIVKIVGKIRNNKINFIKLTNKKASMKDQTIHYEMVFKKLAPYGLVIDYIKVDQEFDYYVDAIFKTRMTSTSNLFFYEYYSPVKEKKLGKQFKSTISDWEKLDRIGYNKDFWENNPIVKRTPIEKEVIQAFEKNNAFESIFLNSRGQVMLLQSKIANDSTILKIDTLLKTNRENTIIEKVYLHTNKDNFSTDEKIWFTVYNTIFTNEEDKFLSEIITVDLLNAKNEIVTTQEYLIDNGRGKGTIKIPANTTTGEYTIRAYPNWMKNFKNNFFFTKKVNINNKQTKNKRADNDTIKMTFYPEGGQLINNLTSRIAFKAIGTDGYHRKVSGVIKDENDVSIINIKSVENGMGYFFFTPKKDKTYKTVLKNGQTFLLPKVASEGFSMFIDNTNDYAIKLRLLASKKFIEDEFYVVGTSYGKKHFQGKFKFGKSPILKTEIPKNRIPKGIYTITIFDKKATPIAERSVFINSENEIHIEAKTNSKKFAKKEDVTLNVKIINSLGKPVETEFSISVLDENKSLKNKNIKNNKNIVTHFLLESDLKGTIEDPAKYFNDNSRANKFKLDLIMMSHQARKITWNKNDTQKQQTIKNFGYDIDELDDVLNNTTKSNNNWLYDKEKSESVLYWKPNIKTNKNGKAKVTFKNFDKTKKIRVHIETLSKNGIPATFLKTFKSK